MDAYIDRILFLHGLGHLPLRTNHLEIKSNGRLDVSFPYYDQGCGHCANCKGGQIKSLRQPGETTIYIGDGYSDLCALNEADVTFAKKDLLEYCRENNKACIEWRDFDDVAKWVKKKFDTSQRSTIEKTDHFHRWRNDSVQSLGRVDGTGSQNTDPGNRIPHGIGVISGHRPPLAGHARDARHLSGQHVHRRSRFNDCRGRPL